MVVEKARSLFEANFKETGVPNAVFCLDEELYKVLEEGTDSFGILAWDGGKAIGYSHVIVGPHPHTSVLYATNDAIYVSPEYRTKGVGGQLVVRSEKEALNRGARSFLWDVPINHGLDIAFSRRSQYQRISVLYSKELNHGGSKDR